VRYILAKCVDEDIHICQDHLRRFIRATYS
jgi:hypothetical protein